MTGRELVEEHNRRCTPGDELAYWKRPKAELVAIVENLVEPEPADAAPHATDETGSPDDHDADGFRNLTEMVRHLLLETDMTYAQIVEAVRARFPGARTTWRSVASVACAIRKAGRNIPLRDPTF